MIYSVYQEGDDYMVLAEGETTSNPTAVFRDLDDAHAFARLPRFREALDQIWHIAPLPTQTEAQRLKRIHGIAREALFPASVSQF